MGQHPMTTAHHPASTITPAETHALEAFAEPIDALRSLAREFHARGWMWGTAGNLSCRAPGQPNRIIMTGSGCDKGLLQPTDMALLDIGDPRENLLPVSTHARRTPSAESPIHTTLYTDASEIGAVLHVHTVASTVISRRFGVADRTAYLTLDGYEMVKGLGIWSGQAVRVGILPNHLQIPAIADDLRRLRADAAYEVPGFLVYGHGVTAWGNSMEQARHHLECLEFLLQCVLAESCTPESSV